MATACTGVLITLQSVSEKWKILKLRVSTLLIFPRCTLIYHSLILIVSYLNLFAKCSEMRILNIFWSTILQEPPFGRMIERVDTDIIPLTMYSILCIFAYVVDQAIQFIIRSRLVAPSQSSDVSAHVSLCRDPMGQDLGFYFRVQRNI